MILNNENFKTEIKETIANLENVDCEIYAKWETLKVKCIEIAKLYGKREADQKAKLKLNLTRLEKILVVNGTQAPYNWDTESALQAVKAKIQELENEKVEAARFCCKIKWQEEGNKPSKYFFNLEKRNYNSKNMLAVILKTSK